MLNLFLRSTTQTAFGFQGTGLQTSNMYTLDATLSTTENWSKTISTNRLQSGQTWVDGQIIKPITYQITGVTSADGPGIVAGAADKFFDRFSKDLGFNADEPGNNFSALAEDGPEGDRANFAIEQLKEIFLAPNPGTSTNDSRFLITIDDGKSHLLRNMTMLSLAINKSMEFQRAVQFVMTFQELTTFNLIRDGSDERGNYVSDNFDPSTGADGPRSKGDQNPFEQGKDWLKKKGGEFSDKFL